MGEIKPRRGSVKINFSGAGHTFKVHVNYGSENETQNFDSIEEFLDVCFQKKMEAERTISDMSFFIDQALKWRTNENRS